MDNKYEREDEESDNRAHGESSTGYGVYAKADRLRGVLLVSEAGAGPRVMYKSVQRDKQHANICMPDVLQTQSPLSVGEDEDSKKKSVRCGARQRASRRARFVVLLGYSLPPAR